MTYSPFDVSHLERMGAWGRNTFSNNYVYRPSTVSDIKQLLAFASHLKRPVVLRGSGCSYGDASLGKESLMLDCSRLCRILAWNPDSGVIVCESGVTIAQIWQYCVGDGWWPPVVSGTMAPTLAGALAMNIHGKNNFVAGTIGDHVLELDVILANGQLITCSRDLEPHLFRSIIGGFGVLGVITRVVLLMKRVYSGYMRITPIYVQNLAHMFRLFDEHVDSSDYLVGWLDAFGTGEQLGRGQIHKANYLKDGEDKQPAKSLRVQAQNLPDNIFGIIPKSILWRFLMPFVNDHGMRLVNGAKVLASRLKDGVVHDESHAGFAFLLDYVPNWKLAYGKEGLIQYQAFVPRGNAESCFRQILKLCQQVGILPYLAVFKQHRTDEFFMTHAVEGFSLALDFKLTRKNRVAVWKLTKHLDEIVNANGGRFYFAKDVTLTPDSLTAYLNEDRVHQFLRLKRYLDPNGLFRSDLFDRIFGEIWEQTV